MVLHVFLDSLPVTSSLRPAFKRHLIPLARQCSRTYTGAALAQKTPALNRESRKEPYKKLQKKGTPPIENGWRVKKPDLIKELQFLNDPLKLAEHVVNLLRQKKALEAVDLVRAASRAMPCTVSWNHIINDALNRGKVIGAVKFYNEVR